MEKHTHQYVRVRKGKGSYLKSLYRCVIEGCPHRLVADLVIGRFSICNTCGRVFTMTKKSITLSKPHCEYCGKNDEHRGKLMELVEKLG